MLDAESARLDTRFRTLDGKTVKFSDLNFAISTTTRDGAEQLIFIAPVAGGQVMQTYTLPRDSYEVRYNLRLAGVALAPEPLVFTFADRVRQTEQDLKQNRNHTTINFGYASGDHDALAEASEKPEVTTLAEPTRWAAHKHDFFVAGFIADSQPFSGGTLNSSVDEADSTYIKAMSSSLQLPLADVTSTQGGQYRFFFGPNSFKLLQEVAPEFDRNVYLGWGLFRWVKPVRGAAGVPRALAVHLQLRPDYRAAGAHYQARNLAPDVQNLRKPGPHEGAQAGAGRAESQVWATTRPRCNRRR